jgi:hypothetical protein
VGTLCGIARAPPTKLAHPTVQRPSPRHERQPLEQVHVLLILDHRAVQRRDQLLRIALAQGLGADVLDPQELQRQMAR